MNKTHTEAGSKLDSLMKDLEPLNGARRLIVSPPLRKNFIARYCASTIQQWSIFEVGVTE